MMHFDILCPLICVFHRRFYFVGDEDLLEIIGNSRNFGRLQKHFRKMFAGVNAIILSSDETIVTGLMSREGEEVRAGMPFVVEYQPSGPAWTCEMYCLIQEANFEGAIWKSL